MKTKCILVFVSIALSAAFFSCTDKKKPEGADASVQTQNAGEGGADSMDPMRIIFSYADKSAKIYDLSKDFSDAQGQNGWTYLCFDGGKYDALEYVPSKSEWSSQGKNAISRGKISPAGTESACAIAWTAPAGGRVSIVGTIENLQFGKNTEGSEAAIYLNEERIWPESGTQRLMSGYSMNHSLVCEIVAGDTIYFRLNSLADDGANAQTRWLPVISYGHEPAALIGGSKIVMDPDEYRRVGQIFTDSPFGIVPKGETNDYYASWADEVFKFSGPPENPTKDKVYMQHEYDFSNPSEATGRWWITNIYVDDRSAEGLPNGLLAFCHIEFGLDGRFWGISLMYSDDDGQEWTKIGVIVEQERDNPMTANILGTPYIIKDGYFFIYYNDYNGMEASMAVARAKVADVIAAARDKQVCEWQKYYNGSFGEPGKRGRFSRIIDQAEWIADDWACHGDAAYSTYLGKYVMSGYNHGKKRGYWLSFSDDGINWSRREWIQEYDRDDSGVSVLSPYQSIMAGDGSDNGVIGRDFYIYSAFYREDPEDRCYLYATKISLNKEAVEELQKNTPVRDKKRKAWDSAADFSDVQGENDWFYMQGNETALYHMGYDKNAGMYGGHGSIGAQTQSSPNAGGFFSARVWSAPREGIVHIWGSAKKEDPAEKSAAEIRISLKNKQMMPEKGRMAIGEENNEIAFDFTVSVFDYDTIIFEAANPDGDLNLPVNLIFDITIEYEDDFGADAELSPLYDIAGESIATELLFSGRQGANEMSYRSWDGKKYGMLDWNPVDARWEIKGTFTIVGINWQHPDGLDSVRTWTASREGEILISSSIKCESHQNEGGDGIIASVRKNDELLWESHVGSEKGNETVACSLRAYVLEGDTINFIVNKNKTPAFDTTLWSPMIKYAN